MVFFYMKIYKTLRQEDTLTAHYGGFKDRDTFSELMISVNLIFRSFEGYEYGLKRSITLSRWT